MSATFGCGAISVAMGPRGDIKNLWMPVLCGEHLAAFLVFLAADLTAREAFRAASFRDDRQSKLNQAANAKRSVLSI